MRVFYLKDFSLKSTQIIAAPFSIPCKKSSERAILTGFTCSFRRTNKYHVIVISHIKLPVPKRPDYITNIVRCIFS